MILSALLLLAGPVAADDIEPSPARPQSAAACTMPAQDRAWLEATLKAWPDVQRRYLGGPARRWPTVIVYDAACRYILAGNDGRLRAMQATRYSGGVTLPGGERMPPGPHALFTHTSNGGRVVLMALPSVWQSARHPKSVPLPWILEGVLFHELTHAYQSAAAPATSFLALRQRGVPSRWLRDDSVQDAYAADTSYAGLVAYERMLLGGVAVATEEGEAREKACEAARAIQDRRRRLAAKAPSLPLAAIDDIANTSEGLGNWVAYRWLTERRGVQAATAAAILGGKSWSQAIGLALFRALDRVSAGWEAQLLSNRGTTALQLLAHACEAIEE